MTNSMTFRTHNGTTMPTVDEIRRAQAWDDPTVESVVVYEPERHQSEIIVRALERQGYRVYVAPSVRSVLDYLQMYCPDAVLIGLSDADTAARDVLSVIHRSHEVPVICAATDFSTFELQIEAGVKPSDFLLKPINQNELAFRVNAAIRTAEEATNGTRHLEIGPIRLDLRRKLAYVGNARLNLTMTEYRILEHLGFHRGVIVDRQSLAEMLALRSTSQRIIDTHFSNLRIKLRVAGIWDILETVRGYGYRLWYEGANPAFEASA